MISKKIAVLNAGDFWYGIDIANPDKLIENVRIAGSVTLITSQTADLVRFIKSEKMRFTTINIIDLECLDKQMSQAGKDVHAVKKWHLLVRLKYHKFLANDFRLTDLTLLECLQGMAKFYENLISKDTDETNRFDCIESQINKIIYRRQFLGVPIDSAIAKQLCSELDAQIYMVKNVLQRKYNIFEPDNEQQQIAYLISKKYQILRSPLFTFKARRNDDDVCKHFYDMLRNQRDLDSLLFMLSHWGGENKAIPTYYGFGTITSRITVREPGIQNLRKGNRKVIVADSGFKLLYIDYSQFEAGILAALSNDATLLKLYDSDIYSDLALSLFNDATKRSDAKVIFYRYMYGDTSLNGASKAYFKKFKGLENFRKSIEDEINKNHRIGTKEGNYRIATEGNCGWALSHLIQSTASLIYKRALIRVSAEVNAAKFLVPMHDGTLYQIPEYLYEATVKKIELIYKIEFEKECPGIIARVNCSDKFYE